MKFRFDEKELGWLDKALKTMSYISAVRGVDGQLQRTIKKMQYKFTPNAIWVNLTDKERAFLVQAITHRRANLDDLSMIGQEDKVLRSIEEKLKREAADK